MNSDIALVHCNCDIRHADSMTGIVYEKKEVRGYLYVSDSIRLKHELVMKDTGFNCEAKYTDNIGNSTTPIFTYFCKYSRTVRVSFEEYTEISNKLLQL